ncbi:hypothetical protein ACFLVH_05215 [Chloroflexota bacterium]
MSKLENMVRKYLSVESFKDKWERDQQIGAGYYYALTYPHILSFFKDRQRLSDSLELKIALIFSWNPTICKVSRESFSQAINDLTALEPFSKGFNNTSILNLDTNTIIKKLWYPVKKATSSRDLTSGVSVTKFLHFSFPHIFPMIDLNTMKKLDGTTVSLKSYSTFLSDWKCLYSQSKEAFDQISKAVDMPITRVLDVMLFTPR